MLTGKLFAGLAGLLLVFAVLPKLHPTPPVPIYLQLVVALSCGKRHARAVLTNCS